MPDPVTVPQAAIPEPARIAAEEAFARKHREAGVTLAACLYVALEAAAPLIRADERACQRSLLPYHIPCCDRFTDAVADLINEHEDTP